MGQRGRGNEKSSEYVAKKLRKYKTETLICTINRMRKFDYSRSSDVHKAYQLNELLIRLTGKRYRMVLAGDRRAPRPEEIDRNGLTVHRWFTYWNDHYACR